MNNFNKNILIIIFIASYALTGCVIIQPMNSEEPSPSLPWCPPLPNCVSTQASTFVHKIAPFVLIMPFDEAWSIIKKEVAMLPAEIIVEHPGYLYAKSYSAVFHFVDYFEVLFLPEEKTLAVRSSSLLGISDFGANLGPCWTPSPPTSPKSHGPRWLHLGPQVLASWP